MAATDQTYRNQRALDIVFGASCGLLLLTTVWMFVQDYNRDFKAVQRTFRDVSAAMSEREMIDKLPDPEQVQAKRDEVTKARRAVEDTKKELAGDERALNARRERQDGVYRGIKAEYDSLTSYYNIAIEHWGAEPFGPRKDRLRRDVDRLDGQLHKLEGQLDEAKRKLDEIEREYQEKVRRPLEPREKELARAEDDLKKITGTFDRAAKAAAQSTWQFGDTFRALPILDAFASPVKINQLWLPELTIDYGGFKDVPRYDRCTTCHLGIDRAAYDKASLARLADTSGTDKLARAREMLVQRQDSGEKLGFDPDSLPSRRRWPVGAIVLVLALLALAGGLTRGYLGHSLRLGLNTALAALAGVVVVGGAVAYFSPRDPVVQSVALTDGQITQYCAHPRLDLFVDANSPHPMQTFGCTACHAGQGSATDFELASHTPDDARQRKEWEEEHGWSRNHFWDFPMLPRRFVESTCVKCHHDLTELIRQGNKDEAPKLLRGYNLVKENGCFGCHEISGFKGTQRVGPDLRLEPAPAPEYLSASEQERMAADPANPPGGMRKVGPALRRLAEKTNQDWVRKWVYSPRGFRPDTKMPHFFGLSNNDEKALEGTGQEKFPNTEVHGIAYYLLAESGAFLDGKDTYRNGLLRGKDSLTDLQKKLLKEALPDKEMKELLDVSRRFGELALLSAPGRAREINDLTTRQRQALERAQELQKRGADLSAEEQDELAGLRTELARLAEGLEKAARPVVSDDILTQEGEKVPLPVEAKNDKEKKERRDEGRRLFTERGCLACHFHEGTTKKEGDTPAVRSEAEFAPDLTRLAAKLRPEKDPKAARHWLVQWIMNPNHHHPRTRMPYTHLTAEDANKVAEWLLSREVTDWTGPDLKTPAVKDLVELARVYLAKAPGFTAGEVDEYLPRPPKEGEMDIKAVPGIDRARLEGMPRDADERRLASGPDDPLTEDKLKWYIGRKAIGRQGCFGCHDIPGFETAKPIGTGLNDWGKKDPDRLAFEDSAIWARDHFRTVDAVRTRKDVEKAIDTLLLKGARGMEAEDRNSMILLVEQKDRDDEANARLDELRKKAEEKLTPNDRKAVAELRKSLDPEVQKEIRDLEAIPEKDRTARDEERLAELRPYRLWETLDGRPPYETIFFDALEHKLREGFLHHKLLAPRSFDFNRIRPWDDRLRMPQFKFARLRKLKDESDEDFQARQEKAEAEAREAVMTFILGLVAEPVPSKYVYHPDPDRLAEVKGREVLEKFNCAGCHQVQPGMYDFKPTEDAVKQLTEQLGRVKDQFATDHFFLGHNAWYGAAPTADRLTAVGYVDVKGTAAMREEGKRNLVLRLSEALRFHDADRVVRDLPAATPVVIPEDALVRRSEPFGGTFTDLMVPYLARKEPSRFKDKEPEARTVLPPPLFREGERVQPDWLYKFLLNPTYIRPEGTKEVPWMVLRMPRFNMSPGEARALVNYFAAVSKVNNPGAGTTYPYVRIPQKDEDYWRRRTKEYVERLKKDKKAFEARVKEMQPAWEARLKRELAGLQDQVPAAEKAVKEGREKKLENLKDLEQTLKNLRGRVKALEKQVKDKDYSALRKRWEESEAYEVDAYRLLTDPQLCLKCHSVGNQEIAGAQGPNLILSHDRLRPDWVERWVANPKRMFTYDTVMPQNFPNKAREVEWDWQQSFRGSPREQVRAVRDVLMVLPRLADMPAR